MERTIKLNRLLFFALSLIVLPSVILAQQTDTLTTKKLEEIIINGGAPGNILQRDLSFILDPVYGPRTGGRL
jgi:hypothetical protein